jgi:hypothetical protein
LFRASADLFAVQPQRTTSDQQASKHLLLSSVQPSRVAGYLYRGKGLPPRSGGITKRDGMIRCRVGKDPLCFEKHSHGRLGTEPG